ncbi:hypothetical protein HYW46_03165 [Candidatus Daviesbacteria bacterium]|nr:hypothetical protein [Candidatus Daviesbacteria bacterium]
MAFDNINIEHLAFLSVYLPAGRQAIPPHQQILNIFYQNMPENLTTTLMLHFLEPEGI